MKNITGTLLAHLQTGGPFTMADLYTITLTSGVILRWTDYDVDVVNPGTGQTHTASGPVLKRSKTRIVIGIEVDTMDLSIYPTTADTINGISLLAAAQAGSFDGATLILERAFLSPAPTALGVVMLFAGRFADVQLSRTEMQARINSNTESLGVMLPRNVYQPGCVHSLYDTDCGLVRTTYGTTTTIGAGCTASLITGTLPQADGYFDRGYVMFVGGALDGIRRTVKSHASGALALFTPLPSVPSIGMSFTAYPGCDKLKSTCATKFSNLVHFRGAPFIPQPETAT